MEFKADLQALAQEYARNKPRRHPVPLDNKQEKQRKETYTKMISSQKGFFVSIFASSFLLSTVLIVAFVAALFKLGFEKPNPFIAATNFSLVGFVSKHLSQAFWMTPPWSGKLSLGAIHDLVSQEVQPLRNLTTVLLQASQGVV